MFDRILVLCGHTDDELGCAGSIIKYLEAGATVYYVAFSTINDRLIAEVKVATALIGILPEHLSLYNFERREFKRDRQKILDVMIELNNTIHPDLIFMPSSFDLHQDHNVVYREGLRAFKHTSIFGYEMPWNNLNFATQAFIKLSEKQIQKKIAAMLSYKSQFNRPYMTGDFIMALARTRGVQIKTEYAEAFEVIRYIG